MTTPDFNLKLNNPDASSITQNTNTQSSAASKPATEKATFLFNGITKEEIGDNFELLKEFEDYDEDKDGKISDKEWDTYNEDYAKKHEEYVKNQKNNNVLFNTINISQLYENGVDGKISEIIAQGIFSEEVIEKLRKADADNDGIVSREEFQSFHYNAKQWETKVTDETKSKSNERKIENGNYTVKQGDTLANIAQDFGVSVLDLYLANKDVLGKDPATIEVGTKIKLAGLKQKSDYVLETDKELIQLINSDSKEEKIKKLAFLFKPKETPLLFVGMTREQAKAMGKETEEKFNEICQSANVVTPEIFSYYQRKMTGMDEDRLLLVAKEILGDELDAKDLQLIFNNIMPTLINCCVQKESPTAKGIQEKVQNIAKKYSGLTNDNALEYSKNFYNELSTLVKDDISSENGAFAYHKNRLKSGDFSDFEIKQLGIQKGVKLTDEQIEKYAALAAKAEYILPIVQSLQEAVSKNVDGKHDKEIMLFITGVGRDFIESPDVRAVIQAYGLEGIIDEISKKFAASTIAKEDKESLGDKNAFIAAVYTATIEKYADEESLQVFIENHSEDIQFIQEITNTVIDSLPDGAQKDAIKQALETATQNITNGTVSSNSGTGKTSNITSSSSPTVSNSSYTAQTYNTASDSYVSSPMMSPNAQNVADLKAAAARYNQEKFSTTTPTQSFKSDLEKFMEDMHGKGAVMKAKFDNMPLGQALSMICDNLNKVPEQLRPMFIEKFTQMVIIKANSHKDLMCKAYITGDDNLRQFLNKNNIITEKMIFHYFDQNVSELKYASKTMQVNYAKFKAEEQKSTI